jgi:uncharacterized coiled-coil DUF342 family protein
MSPEERDAFRAQMADWAEERRRFGELIERVGARLERERERRERRRRLVRRVVTLGLSDR